MKNISKPILLNKITDEVVIEILNQIIPALQAIEVNYFIVGAFARDVELLAKGHDEPPKRKTNDLDLAIMVSSVNQFEELKNSLSQIDGFELHPTEPIKLIYQEKYEVDLLPFGEIENEKGQVELKAKKAFILNMPGFNEVFPEINIIPTDKGYNLNVCSLPGIVLLKLIAWNDRKHRTKDIVDIEYIIRNLYMLDIEDIVSTNEDILDIISEKEKNYPEMVTARYIGRKIGFLIKESGGIIDRVLNILNTNTESPESSAIARIMTFNTIEESIKIIYQLKTGIEDILNP